MGQKYSAIVFDLGNVLIPFNHGIIIDRLNEIKPNLGKRFYQFYMDNYYIHRDFEKGVLSQKEFIKIMLNVCENIVDEITFCKIYSGVFSIDEKVVSLLPKLKDKYRLFLLSNTNPIHKEYGYKHYEFLKYFEKLFLSFEVGSLKPEPEIYKAVEDYTKLKPQEHIFIDDIKEYADAAKLIGWDGIHFLNYNQLVDELRKRNILL